MFWLKLLAPSNMRIMFETPDMSQLEMSSLNVLLF